MPEFDEKWDTIPLVSYKDLRDILETLFHMEDPTSLLIFGPPGVGKTRIVEDFAKEKNLDLRIKFLSRTEPTDWLGIPTVVEEQSEKSEVQSTEKYTVFITPRFLRRTSSAKSGRILFFFDEINTAPPQVLNSALDVILNKRVEDHALPKNTMIVAAGNYGKEDGTYVEELSKAVKTRFLQIRLHPDPQQWLEWAQRFNIHEKIIKFINKNPNCLLDWQSLQQENAQQVATPRGWEKLSDVLKQIEKQENKPEAKLRLVKIFANGILGKVGQSFYEFYEGSSKAYQYIDLSVGDIFNKITENKVTLPDIVQAISDSVTKENINTYGEKLVELLSRLSPASYSSVAGIIASNSLLVEYIRKKDKEGRLLRMLQQ